MSFVFDDNRLLKHKDSPIDQGKEIFEKTYFRKKICEDLK